MKGVSDYKWPHASGARSWECSPTPLSVGHKSNNGHGLCPLRSELGHLTPTTTFDGARTPIDTICGASLCQAPWPQRPMWSPPLSFWHCHHDGVIIVSGNLQLCNVVAKLCGTRVGKPIKNIPNTQLLNLLACTINARTMKETHNHAIKLICRYRIFIVTIDTWYHNLCSFLQHVIQYTSSSSYV